MRPSSAPSVCCHLWSRTVAAASCTRQEVVRFSKTLNVSAPKLGLMGMARTSATEMAQRNITFNVAHPGQIDTSKDLSWYPSQNTRDAGKISLKGLRLLYEIAGASLFLASEESVYITGQTLHVNDGSKYF